MFNGPDLGPVDDAGLNAEETILQVRGKGKRKASPTSARFVGGMRIAAPIEVRSLVDSRQASEQYSLAYFVEHPIFRHRTIKSRRAVGTTLLPALLLRKRLARLMLISVR
jgi:hypothetical protein